jgi:hypothetical protein
MKAQKKAEANHSNGKQSSTKLLGPYPTVELIDDKTRTNIPEGLVALEETTRK